MKRRRLAMLFVVLVLVLLYLILAYFGTSASSQPGPSSATLKGDEAWTDIEAGRPVIAVHFDITPARLQPGSKTTLQLKGASYRQMVPTGQPIPRELCILSAIARTDRPTGYEEGYPDFYLTDPICGELYIYSHTADSRSELVRAYVDFRDKAQDLTINVNRVENHFLYPFDAFEVYLRPRCYYFVKYDGLPLSQTVTAAYEITQSPMPFEVKIATGGGLYTSAEVFSTTASVIEQLEMMDWQSRAEVFEHRSERSSSTRPYAVFSFARPLVDRIMFPVIATVVLLFIILLCFVDRLENMIEGAVGVFFGIFGMTQVLLPANTEIRTVVHYATWGLYVALAGVVISHLFLALRQTLGRPRNSEVQDEGEQQGIKVDSVPGTTSQEVSGQARGSKPVLIGAFAFVSLAAWWVVKHLRRD